MKSWNKSNNPRKTSLSYKRKKKEEEEIFTVNTFPTYATKIKDSLKI